MTPLEFLKEEFENVQRALRETLRHDYGPQQAGDYYKECEARLHDIGTAIASTRPQDAANIYAYLGQLSNVAAFVSLIERSHLGEFSWPFSDELARMAKLLLVEKNLRGDPLDPIIHVVAEGQGYRIIYETQVPVASGRRRFLVVAFPRSLKHHVLLHALFGHELGHTALHATQTGTVLQGAVLAALTGNSPLKDAASMNLWLNSATAHQDVKNELLNYQNITGNQFVLTALNRDLWLIELICDLFGLLLIGPAFFAAHRTYLSPLHPSAYTVNTAQPTHPPFAVRHKMLVQAMRLLNWDSPITRAADGAFHSAEKEMLKFILNDPFDAWAQLFADADLKVAVDAIKHMLAQYGGIAYAPISSAHLVKLVDRLVNGLPPVLDEIDQNEKPQLVTVKLPQTLYAGWMCWLGKQYFPAAANFDFLTTNQLCDYALLQQRAIDLALASGIP